MNNSDSWKEGWDVIATYSRKEAIEDGYQVLATPETTKEAGIKFPVFLTRSVYEKYVQVPEGMEGYQQEDARLWDILTMFKYFIRVRHAQSEFTFQVSVTIPRKAEWLPNEKKQRDCGQDQRMVTLYASCGPLDFDNTEPAITIMLPGED